MSILRGMDKLWYSCSVVYSKLCKNYAPEKDFMLLQMFMIHILCIVWFYFYFLKYVCVWKEKTEGISKSVNWLSLANHWNLF